MSGHTALWLIWFAMFAGIEGTALFNSRKGDTLSEHIWAWFGTERRTSDAPAHDRSGWAQARRAGLLMFMTWLTAHFMTGGWV